MNGNSTRKVGVERSGSGVVAMSGSTRSARSQIASASVTTSWLGCHGPANEHRVTTAARC